MLAAFAGAALAAAPAGAQSITGHYPAGAEGIRAGTTPPPGQYTKLYNLFYTADEFMGADGRSADPNFSLFSYTAALRHFWITDLKILGATYGMDVAVLLTDNELKVSTPGGILHRSTVGFGDMLIQPLVLAWHGSNWDACVLYGLWVPTGTFDAKNPASVGKGFWTHMAGLGTTWYPDAAKSWSVSLANRLEYHTENHDLNVTPGKHYSLEAGVAKHLGATWEVAAVGTIAQKITDDRGSGVTYDPSIHDRAFAAGVEVTKFFPAMKTQLSLRWLHEFNAIERPQGDAIWLSLAKIW